MAAAAQVVDIGIDPLESRRRHRRALKRIGLPIAGVTAVVLAILGIALYSDRVNREGAMALSSDLLETLDSRIAVTVSSYLDPAARFVRLARDVVGGDPTSIRQPLAETTAFAALDEIPQVAILSFADEDGNYVMVRRGVAGGYDTKIIRNIPGPRRVTWIRRNAANEEVVRAGHSGDMFDPRERPWYQGAAATDELFWTDVYVFYTDRKPGVTVSVAHRDTAGRLYVFGADITLDALSNFLSTLEIGENGRAAIIDETGRLIAAPTGVDMLSESEEGTLTARRVDQVGDPVMAAAYDHYRVEGLGRRVIEVGGERYITAVTPLPTAARDWLVLMTVPEEDFVGFVTSNNRIALTMSLAVVGIAAVLAFLLVRQGLRADRAGRLLRDRQRALRRQSDAFGKLAANASLFDPARNEPPRALTETLSEVAGARRASLWRLTADRRILRCDDSYDRQTGGHIDGLELHRDEMPRFFQNLLEGEEIEAENAAADPRTSELHRIVMAPLGSRSLLSVPVWRQEQVAGAVWLEDRSTGTETRDFVRAAANMVALRMSEHGSVAPPPRRAEVEARPEPAPRVRSYTAELARRGIDPDTIDGDIYPEIAVMVVHFVDPVSIAVRPPT